MSMLRYGRGGQKLIDSTLKRVLSKVSLHSADNFFADALEIEGGTLLRLWRGSSL